MREAEAREAEVREAEVKDVCVCRRLGRLSRGKEG